VEDLSIDEIPRHRQDDNIKPAFRELVWERADWIHMAQNRILRRSLANMVLNRRVP
jgi:hypothetical protein